MNSDHDRRRGSQLLLLSGAFVSCFAAIGFWFLYFTLYWPYRNLFDDAGRYFDERSLVVYQEQSGALIAPALALSALAVACAVAWRLRRRAVYRQDFSDAMRAG